MFSKFFFFARTKCCLWDNKDTAEHEIQNKCSIHYNNTSVYIQVLDIKYGPEFHRIIAL